MKDNELHSRLIQIVLNRHINLEEYLITASAVDDSLIKAYEKKIGFELPEDFKVLMKSKYGGCLIEVKPEIWPSVSAYEVGSYWTFLRGFSVFTLHPDAPENIQLEASYEQFRKLTGIDYHPFMKLYTEPDLYVFDSKQNIYKWDHETNEVENLNMSFMELFERNLKELDERKERYIKEIKK